MTIFFQLWIFAPKRKQIHSLSVKHWYLFRDKFDETPEDFFGICSPASLSIGDWGYEEFSFIQPFNTGAAATYISTQQIMQFGPKSNLWGVGGCAQHSQVVVATPFSSTGGHLAGSRQARVKKSCATFSESWTAAAMGFWDFCSTWVSFKSLLTDGVDLFCPLRFFGRVLAPPKIATFQDPLWLWWLTLKLGLVIQAQKSIF